MSEQNPFEELDNLSSKHELEEKKSLQKVQRDVEGSYNISRDIFTAVSTLTDKLFTVFSGVIEFFDTQEEEFRDTSGFSKKPDRSESNENYQKEQE